MFGDKENALETLEQVQRPRRSTSNGFRGHANLVATPEKRRITGENYPFDSVV